MTAQEDAPVALVTGAANGIGLATAHELARTGHRVVIADLDGDAALEAATQLGAGAHAVQADVADTASVNAMVAATLERFGRLDVLVSNAGFPASHPSATIGDDEWSSLLDVHLGGTLRCARAAHPALTAAPAPAIVNVSSVAASVGMPGRAAYASAKAGIEGLTRVLAVEWAPDAIRVNAIAPCYVRTAGFDRRMVDARAHVVAELEAEVPLGRLCRPEEVATVIRFLASGDASYVTGQTIIVDGGVSISASG